jgi:hypothetical protein
VIPRKPRFPVSWPLMYRSSGDHEWHAARSTNISLSGILFRAENPLAIDSAIDLRIWIQAPGLEPTLVSAGGRVVRSDASLPDGIAVKFNDSAPKIARTMDPSMSTY